jgi:hypothetical protein
MFLETPDTGPETAGTNLSVEFSFGGANSTDIARNGDAYQLTITPYTSGLYNLTSSFNCCLSPGQNAFDNQTTDSLNFTYYILKDYDDSGLVASFDILKSVRKYVTPNSLNISVFINEVIQLDADITYSLVGVISDQVAGTPITNSDVNQTWVQASLTATMMVEE